MLCACYLLTGQQVPMLLQGSALLQWPRRGGADAGGQMPPGAVEHSCRDVPFLRSSRSKALHLEGGDRFS